MCLPSTFDACLISSNLVKDLARGYPWRLTSCVLAPASRGMPFGESYVINLHSLKPLYCDVKSIRKLMKEYL